MVVSTMTATQTVLSTSVMGRNMRTTHTMVEAGSFVNVRITGTSDGDLTGEIEE